VIFLAHLDMIIVDIVVVDSNSSSSSSSCGSQPAVG
jgi:hypothetical protein